MANKNLPQAANNGKNSSAWMTHSQIRQFLAEFHETQQQFKKEQAEFRDFSLVVCKAVLEHCASLDIVPPGFNSDDLNVAHVWLEQMLTACLEAGNE